MLMKTTLDFVRPCRGGDGEKFGMHQTIHRRSTLLHFYTAKNNNDSPLLCTYRHKSICENL